MMWPRVVVVLVVLQALLTDRAATSPLHFLPRGVHVSDLIRYSESVQYDPVPIAVTSGSEGSRSRRHLNQSFNKPLRISFKAFHRDFNLVLREDDSVFAEDAVFETPSGHVHFDVGRVYSGQVEGEPDSIVHGLVTTNGRFDGTVESRGELFYVEPASRYGATDPRVHTVIYRNSDVQQPDRTSLPCASQRLHLRRRRASNEFTESSVLKTYLNGPDGTNLRRRPNSTFHRPTVRPAVFQNPVNRPRVFSTPACDLDNLSNDTLKHVIKRATVDPKKTTCMLYLQADHLFFQKYGTEEACIEVMTRHVQRVNSIYRNTDFNQDGRSDNISFMIKRIKVHTVEATNEPGYRFPGNYGVEKFLELFSEEDYDAFCLAYMFTYRDFEMGTLGLAWTGDLKNAGGVCEKNGHYRGSLKSLNTGIVTLLNYGKHVPPAVSHVTLAHEIGHNFGSPHDPEMCTPGGEDGNYIMFARATSGDKKNNNKFSPCSLNSINPVLNTKARSHMGCFTEPQLAICGNGVVEAGEECDCGWEEDCRDSCCFPQRRYPPSGEPPCRLTPHSVCSPSQGPCCTSDCQLKFGDKCRDDNGCRDSSFCDGRTPTCPPSVNKPNKTICNQEFVCFMGECTGSICLAYGLESCQCMPGPEDPPTKACELCCKKPGDDQPCLSSFDWNDAPYDIPDMFSKPGTPCSDYNGYCDVFQRCREVDPSGPLATLRKLLLSEESLASFKKWVSSHWYAVLVVVCTVLILLILSTKLLGKQGNVKLKSMTIMHSATTETVRLPTDGEAALTVHPPAVRSKLPLHRKVREKKLHSKVVSRRKKKTKPASGEEVKKIGKTVKDKLENGRDYRREVSQEAKQKSKQTPTVTKSADTEPTTEPPTITHPAPIYENIPIANKSDDHPKLSTGKIISSRLKRSNRVSTEITSEGAKKLKEDQTAKKENKGPVVVVPAKKQTHANGSPAKRKKRKKETVEEGEVKTKVDLPAEDPVGKVHNWLLQSISSAKDNPMRTLTMPKSRSSPAVGAVAKTRPHKPERTTVHVPKAAQPRSHSAGNLRKEGKKDEKVKLQVVYRPPFKLSLKLRNNVTAVRTRVAPDRPTSGTRAVRKSQPRTAVLVSTPDDIDSNVHTVPSDLDVLLSESEFLFSDA